MAIGTATPRDKLDKLIAFIRRTLSFRYLVLIGAMAVVGAALSTLLALKQKPKYMSEARLLYNERINSSFVVGRDLVQRTRNLGNRYSEILLARPQLTQLIRELNDEFEFVDDLEDQDEINEFIEEFKPQIQFRVRGTGMFHIQYLCADPDEAFKVTDKLATILMDKDRELRQEGASETLRFLREAKENREVELSTRLADMNRFLAKHPEFAQDAILGARAAQGASIRDALKKGKNPEEALRDKNMDPRLRALYSQRDRYKRLLEDPDRASKSISKTPEVIEAEQDVRQARQDRDRAKSNLERERSKYKDDWPSVKTAKRQLEQAETTLADAERALKTAKANIPPPVTIDRSKLEQQISELNSRIAQAKRSSRKDGAQDKKAAPDIEDPVDEIVGLENEFQALSQAVEEARSRVGSLADKVANAEITAEQQLDTEAAVLTVIDPANRPTKPMGKGKLLLLIAGTFVFIVLGSVLAMALAFVDDRIYTAGDLEQLGIAPVMVVIPKAKTKRKLFRRG